MKKATFIIALFLSSSALFAQQPNRLNKGIDYFPDYHPLVVHFPLILLLVAAVMQIVLLFRSTKLFNYTVTALTVLGFLPGFWQPRYFMHILRMK